MNLRPVLLVPLTVTLLSLVPGVLDELKRQHFAGNISVEYEHNQDHNVTDPAQCIGLVRGYETGVARKP